MTNTILHPMKQTSAPVWSQSKVMTQPTKSGTKQSQTKLTKIMDMYHIPINNIPKYENDPPILEFNKLILRSSDA